MEAKKFGFGSMPPAFKFDPTDADIVAHYLLPHALDLPNPYDHAIIEDDPASAPPWEILQRHGNLDHAFFFGPPRDLSKNAGRRVRNIPGGVWQGQKSTEDTVTLLRPGGGEVDIRYKRYDLSFSLDKNGRSTGYIMHEYEILSPSLPATVLTRIRVPKKGNKKPVAPAAAEPQVPDPEQTGPSYKYDAPLVLSNGEGFGGAQVGAPNGGVMVKNAGYYSSPLRYVLPEAGYDNTNCASIPDQSGASYNYDAAAMNGEGFTGAQAHAFSGGGMVDTSGAYYDPSGYVPECSGDYSNYYAEYQQWQNQQDPSSQYHAGDAAESCTGGEGFSGEQQAGALCCNSDNGSVVGTETSAHSTISLCGDGEVACDNISFYNLLFDDTDDLKCEQNVAGDLANELLVM